MASGALKLGPDAPKFQGIVLVVASVALVHWSKNECPSKFDIQTLQSVPHRMLSGCMHVSSDNFLLVSPCYFADIKILILICKLTCSETFSSRFQSSIHTYLKIVKCAWLKIEKPVLQRACS